MLTSSQPTDYTQQQYYSVDNSLNDQLINQAFVTNTQTYQSTNTKKNCYIPQIQQQFHPQLITTCKNNVLATMVKKNLVSSLLCFIHTTRKAPLSPSPFEWNRNLSYIISRLTFYFPQGANNSPQQQSTATSPITSPQIREYEPVVQPITDLQQINEQQIKVSPPQVKKSNLSVLEKELQKIHQKQHTLPVVQQPKTIEPLRRVSRFSVIAVAEKSAQLVRNSSLQLNLNSPAASVYNPGNFLKVKTLKNSDVTFLFVFFR